MVTFSHLRFEAPFGVSHSLFNFMRTLITTDNGNHTIGTPLLSLKALRLSDKFQFEFGLVLVHHGVGVSTRHLAR